MLSYLLGNIIFTLLVNFKNKSYICIVKHADMVIKFDKEYLSELYTNGCCKEKKYRFQPQVIRNYVRRIVTLAEAPNIEALYPLHSLNYEVLVGDKKGISSIRIDRQYRLEFLVSMESNEPIITICTILDITNHYK